MNLQSSINKEFNSEILSKVKEIISKYTDVPHLLDTIEGNTNVNFIKELHIDSVDVVEIVVDVEEAFGIEIMDEEIKSFKSFEDMYNLVETKITLSNS